MANMVGFTGTQMGLQPHQLLGVEMALYNFYTWGINVFLHGDCIGADAEATALAAKIGYKIHAFPSNIEYKRAFTIADVIEEPDEPLARNHKIVDHCNILIAAPFQRIEVMNSGTWSTIRYARKLDKRIEIVYP